MRTLLCAILSLVGGSIACADAVFPNFTPANTAGVLVLAGNAQVRAGPNSAGDTNYLHLVSNTTSQDGSAFSNSQVNVAAGTGFSTVFQFRNTNPGGIDPADGIVFVAQNVSSSLGGAGGGLGYAGVPHSVGVELDTYDNGAGTDVSDNELAIDLNGNVSHSAGTVVDLNNVGAGDKLSNGHVWTAWVDYDANAKILSASVNETGIKPVSAMLSMNVDLASAGVIGQGTAFVGFTGATGAGYENEDILNWSYFDHLNLEDTVAPLPTVPAATLLLLTMTGAFVAFRRIGSKHKVM